MDMDNAAAFLAGSILHGIGITFLIICGIAVNNIIHRYWKPVRIWTADSWVAFNHNARYATEEEMARIAPEMDKPASTSKK